MPTAPAVERSESGLGPSMTPSGVGMRDTGSGEIIRE